MTDGVFLDRSDCKDLEPIIRKAADKERALAEKYRDLLDGGYGTERQADLWIQHENRADRLGNILQYLKRLI